SRLPVVPAVGVDLAVHSARQAGTAPTIGAIAGLIVAVTVGAAATVIASSNDDLQTTPQLYGEPWDANVSMTPDLARSLASKLEDNEQITALALAAGGAIEVEDSVGDTVELIAVGFELLNGQMVPAILDGRAPRSADEVALGSESFNDLDVAMGDHLRAVDGTPLTIVGRVIVPIVGADSPDRGAVLTLAGFESHGTPDVQGEVPEVAVAFDVPPGEDLAVLLDDELGPEAALLGAPARTPTDVTTLAGIGRFPAAVGGFTGVLAAAALGHALLVTVRRRGKDLATLRALGMLRRHAAATVVIAGATMAAAALVVGMPLGVAAGRLLWRVITDSIDVVNQPATPVVLLAMVASLAAFGAALATSWPTLSVLRLRLWDALRAD
ncbi:MAG: FtsX-like permease family protein, partial [Acidimicrobiales bacterium]